jgi:penicillin-binding protein 2
VLAGRDGFERYAVNARGARDKAEWAARAMEGQATLRPPERGHDIVLTIDQEVQKILYKALEGVESGAAVVMDPNDGSLLGLVSKPTFDPNQWSGRLSPEVKKAVDENPYLPMLDKSVHAYFPGSVYKVVTALAALEEGLLDADEAIESPGSYEYGNRTFHCHKRSGHGKVDLNGAMAASADVYFYRLGEALGIDTLAKHALKFGFGVASGLGINGDAKGMVPTRAYHDATTKGGFQHGLALSTAIGQGDVRTSPVQMAMAYAALANGGTVYNPRIVDRIVDEDGAVVSRLEPQVRGHLDADPSHLAAVTKALERAVNDEKLATGHLAAVSYGLVAGKTGTAQVRKIIRGHRRQSVKRFRDRDHAWFSAFAPYESPKIVVVVFLEHGGSGGKDAAPITRRIIEAYHQQIEPIFSATAANEKPRRRRGR